jgi:hypothetical protein
MKYLKNVQNNYQCNSQKLLQEITWDQLTESPVVGQTGLEAATFCTSGTWNTIRGIANKG